MASSRLSPGAIAAVDEFDQYQRVVDDDAGDADDGDEAVDGKQRLADQRAEDDADDREHDGREHEDGLDVGLELGGQDQIDDQYRQRKGAQQAVEGALRVFELAAEHQRRARVALLQLA